MGWGKALKKIARTANKAVRGTAALFTAGASEYTGLGKKLEEGMEGVESFAGYKSKEEERAEKLAKQQAAEENAANKANKEFIASVNRQREASLLGKTKTDYTGDLSDNYEDAEETTNKLLSRPLVTKRRKLLGM